MPDYGHDLQFGVFLTPTARDADAVVERAVAAERAGFDLVTFQDHPYQPAFLDTWTLLSWVAARTERVHLSGNVLSLPLRQPAVLARAVASLDLLSGGRVDLGLGAGAFWDAIEAMGGRRLSPGQAVRALEDAIDVMRGVWDAGNRTPLRVDGEVHQVRGAKRGPAPAHDVPIWLGAYKPRMLRLIGRKADGWLPSLGYLAPGDLATGNKIIDEAAHGAGRDPREIRRLLNLTGADAGAEELVELALTDGIGTFVVSSDDPVELTRFAAEVAPAVRELVAAGRASAPEPVAAQPDPPIEVQDSAAAPDSLDADALRTTSVPGVTPTPDDGTRLSSRRVWDESTRPSAPAPPAGTGYTEQGRAVSQHLIDVHDMLRGELTQLRDVTAQVLAGRVDAGSARSVVNEMTLRQNDWVLGAYCARYCSTVTGHHSLEDASIMPYLRRRDPDLAPVVDRLVAEHVDIHHVLEDVDRALVAYVADDDRSDGGAALREAVDVLTDTLLSHLSYEERELTAPLARYGMAPGQV